MEVHSAIGRYPFDKTLIILQSYFHVLSVAHTLLNHLLSHGSEK